MGWYPDPADARRERYWDGQAWTHNVKDAPTTLPPPPPAPQFSPQPAAAPTPGYGPVSWTPTYAPLPSRRDRTLDGVPLAGWWWRCLAFVIDQVLVGRVAVPHGWVVLHPMLSAFAQYWRDTMAAANAGTSLPASATQQLLDTIVSRSYWWNAVFYGVFIGYNMVMLRVWGATLGKLATGLRVVPVDNGRAGRVSLSQAFVRPVVAAAAAILSPLNLLDVLMPLWTMKRQALHDMPAKTQVVRIVRG